MSWWMGAGLGFLRGGPLGALVGGAAQYFLTKKLRARVQKSLPGIQNEGVFATCVIIVMTKVGMAQGDLTAAQVETVYRFFVNNLNYTEADFEAINRVIRETYQLDPPLDSVIQKYKESAASRYRLLLLALSYQITLVNGKPGDAAQKEINRIAELLGITYEQHDSLRKKYALGDLVTPYTILEVDPSATQDEIKKAYRKLASQFHPDRVAHLGGEHVELAHLKFLEVQEAYRELSR